MDWVTLSYACVYVFVTLSILQPKFIEEGFRKRQSLHTIIMVLLMFLCTPAKFKLNVVLKKRLPNTRNYSVKTRRGWG